MTDAIFRLGADYERSFNSVEEFKQNTPQITYKGPGWYTILAGDECLVLEKHNRVFLYVWHHFGPRAEWEQALALPRYEERLSLEERANEDAASRG